MAESKLIMSNSRYTSLLEAALFFFISEILVTNSSWASTPTVNVPISLPKMRSIMDTLHPTMMQKVVVHKETGHVYVGARNALYHFNASLDIIAKASLGPKLDSNQCLHPIHSCVHPRKATDYDHRVLDIFYYSTDLSFLFMCSNMFQGICHLRNISDISMINWIHPFNESVGFTAANGSSVAFFASGYGGQLSVYSASSYDGRPMEYSPISVSSKALTWDNNAFRFKYSYQADGKFTGVNLEDSFKFQKKVLYFTGFDHGNFAYFLTGNLMTGTFETRLARVCKEDNSFFSYMEVPLNCKYGLEIYDVVNAAYLGVASAQLKQRFNLEKIFDVLYVSFLKATPKGGMMYQRNKGTVICAFPMSRVISSFTNAIRDCFNAEPQTRLLQHITGVGISCTKRDDIVIDDNFCGSGFNPYIEGRESIQGEFLVHSSGSITSLAMTLQGGEAILFAGTSAGKVLKFDVDRSENQLLYSMRLLSDENEKDSAVRKSNAFDLSHENIYFLIGKTFIKFPVGSCTTYPECGYCLKSGDPLGCGWCGDHCAHVGECETPDIFSTDSCTPIIYEVYPLSGPANGGTVITITGDNFGRPFNKQNLSKLSVEVAGSPCEIYSWEMKEVKCKTTRVSNANSAPIHISVPDMFSTLGEYKINGMASSSLKFTFSVPKLYGFHPGKGPISGGTEVFLIGENLNIGGLRSVNVAGIPCKNISFGQNITLCITDRLPNGTVSSESHEGPVEVHIDDAVVGVEDITPYGIDYGKTLYRKFTYLPDPEIHDIYPQATTMSGTKNLTITGLYLDNVENPKLIVNVASSITGEVLQVPVEFCSVNPDSNGTIMECPTPALENLALHSPIDKAPLIAHVSFEMDGVQKLKQLPMLDNELSRLLYYPDPVYEPFQEENRVKKVAFDQSLLEIKGKYLDLAHTPTDVKVLIDGAELCNVASISFDNLLCAIPSSDSLQPTNSSLHSVEVLVGSLKFDLGYLEFVSYLNQEMNQGLKAGHIVGMVLSILFVLIICVILYLKYGRRKHKIQYQGCEVELAECKDIDREVRTRAPKTLTSSDYHGYGYARKSLGQSSSAATASEHATIPAVEDETMNLLQSENILIRRDYLTLGEVIGHGHFGCVYKGILKNEGKADEVAVKTLHNTWSNIEQDMNGFLQEGLLMKDFHHKNVLTLIGVCFETDGSPMVVLPYMKCGDLHSYITNENVVLSLKDILMFGVQIAAGMKYLAGIKFVHRDLAARNCTLDEDHTVKVADFGLSRDIYERDYYSSDDKKAKLPVKWMAPESLEKGIYTNMTDVWSYGVVLWEIMTRGVTPYPDVDNWDILRYLKSGRRMPQPSLCPKQLYEIMLKCWMEDSKRRPSFAELEVAVQSVFTNLQKKEKHQAVELNVTYVNYPQETSSDEETEKFRT